jgi:hypothetical protein
VQLTAFSVAAAASLGFVQFVDVVVGGLDVTHQPGQIGGAVTRVTDPVASLNALSSLDGVAELPG